MSVEQNKAIAHTPKFQLPYLNQKGVITPAIESQRYITLDVQLEALFTILGNGVLDGWAISTTPEPTERNPEPDPIPLTVFIKPGSGHVNFMFAETLIWQRISGLVDGTETVPGLNYLYATTDEDTPLTKSPVFFVSNIPVDQENVIPIGLITVVNGIASVSDGDRTDIGFLNVLFNSLLEHRHGKDGIPAVDLATEVKGILSSENIADIPAERVTTGILDPTRFDIPHSELLNAGVLTHEDIDSLIKKLQKTNQRLFGDISASNLLQLVIELKKIYPNCDRYFRNLFVVVPGVDNITFDNPKTFLEPASAHEINFYNNGTGQYTSSYDGDDEDEDVDIVVFNPDAAIINYEDQYITGAVAYGQTTHEVSIDTENEFRRGEFDEDFVSVTSSTSSFMFGYGYGYGTGADFFDVFGIASATVDMYGTPTNYGYGTPEFEAAYAENWGYGYGYEYIQGGSNLPGSAYVTLKAGNAIVKIFDKDDETSTIPTAINIPTNFGTADLANINDITRWWNDGTTSVVKQFIERFNYTPAPTTDGNIGQPSINNVRLVYTYDIDNEDDAAYWDFSKYDNMFIYFRPVNGTDLTNRIYLNKQAPTAVVEDIEQYDWKIRLVDYQDKTTSAVDLFHDENSEFPVSTDLANSARYRTMTYAENDNGDLEFELTIPILGRLAYAVESGFDINKIKRIEIYADGYAPEINGFTDPCNWDNTLHKVSFGGTKSYSNDDEKNKIDHLYLVVPSNPAAKLETISWIADEPSNSRILIYVKSVDSNGSGQSGFDMLENAQFGNPYMNKARGAQTARPSGSSMTDPDGTHIEIKVVLQPSTDLTFVPTLRSISLRYSTVGGTESVVYDTEQDYNLTVAGDNRRINVEVSPDGKLVLDNYSDVRLRRFGLNGQFQELQLIGTSYVDPGRPDYYGAGLPRVQEEYLNGDSISNYGVVAAIKRLSDGNLAIADSTNDRVVIINGKTNQFIRGFYGSRSYGNTNKAATFQLVFSHYNPNTATLYASFSHKVKNPVVNAWILVDVQGNTIALNDQIVNGETVRIVPSNGLGSRDVAEGGMVEIKLSEKNALKLQSFVLPVKLTIATNTEGQGGSVPGILPAIDIADIDYSSYTRRTLEYYNIFYGPISCPIDLKVDENDNILLAQVRDENSANDATPIYKFNPTEPPPFGAALLADTRTIDDGPAKVFSFDRKYFGSVEEIINNVGDIQLLIADCNNKRVILFNTSTKRMVTIFQSTDNLYPTCATLGANQRYYIALTDKAAGDNGKIIEVDHGGNILNTFLEGDVGTPRDVYYLSNNKLLIST